MPRARSGSFYCPLEDAASPLSLSQKAAISTAHHLHSSSLPSLQHSRRPTRTPSFDGAVSLGAPMSVTLPPGKLQSSSDLITRSHLAKRYSWSPRRPSPLARQVDAPPPNCPSVLEKPFDLLSPPLSSSHLPSALRKSRPLLRQSVLKNTFLSSPMGEKACLYGLRVAWCVWGDVKDVLAKKIYRPNLRGGSFEEETVHYEHASDALSPPPSSVRKSSLRRENSFVWEEQAPVSTPPVEVESLGIFDFDFEPCCQEIDDEESSESEYEDEEGDTESDELDLSDIELGLEDEEEVEREFGRALKDGGHEVPEVDDDWKVLSLRI